MHSEGHTTWLEIDLGAIKNNTRELMRLSQRPLAAVVKANAYGHGVVRVAQAASQAGANWLAVARYEEAKLLRSNWIMTDTLVMGYSPVEYAQEAARENIRLAVFDRDTAQAYSQSASGVGMTLRVHVKVDTGMNRIGIRPEDGLEFIHWLHGLPGIEVEGVFTHFARADEPEEPATRDQIRRFDSLLDGLTQAGLRPALVHASNSGAVINFPSARYDLVRCGIALYGLHPSAQTVLPDSFRPALALKTRLTAIKELPAGAGVSYNHLYTTKKRERIGTLAIGYADGLRRIKGNLVLIRGKEAPIVGAVCMDQCMVQLDGIPEAETGDEVVVIGQQGDLKRSAEQVAGVWGTINYEVTCGMAERLPRNYFQ